MDFPTGERKYEILDHDRFFLSASWITDGLMIPFRAGVLINILGYLKDSNAATHSVDTGIS